MLSVEEEFVIIVVGLVIMSLRREVVSPVYMSICYCYVLFLSLNRICSFIE